MANDIVLGVGLQVPDSEIRRVERRISSLARSAPPIRIRVDREQVLGRMSRDAQEFSKSMSAANARVLSFTASAGALFAIQRAFRAIYESSLQVEKSLTDINVVFGLSAKQLNTFSNQLFKVANETGQSFKVASEAAVELARQGLSTEETLKRLKDALILTRRSGIEATKSVETITAALNSFQDATLDSTILINKLISVDTQFAVSLGDLAEGFRRVGSTAVDAGVGINELAGLITAAQQITARGGSVIGNSLKTIFQRIQRPQVLETLKEMNVLIEDQAGNMLSADKVLVQLARAYDTATAQQKNFITQLAAGVFQANQFKAILSDLSKENSIFSRATNVAATATDQISRQQEELNKTLAASVNALINNLTQAGAKLGDSIFRPLVDRLGTYASGFSDIIVKSVDGEKGGNFIAKGVLKGIGDFLSGPGLAIAGTLALKFFGQFGSFAARSLANIIESSQREVRTREQIHQLLARQPELTQQIIRGELSREQIQQRILGLLRQEMAVRAELSQVSVAVAGLRTAGIIRTTDAGFKLSAGAAVRNKAVGFIPEIQEKMGAYAGGYQPGQVKETNIPKLGKVYYNTAETIKKFPQFEQPAIMPPQNSRAGLNYRKGFERSHGFDPYKSEGLVPNYVRVSLSAFRGEGGPPNGKFQYGRGKYSSNLRSEAALYGNVTQSQLTFESPLVLDFTRQHKRELIFKKLRKLGIERPEVYPGGLGFNTADILSQKAKEAGYGGTIIRLNRNLDVNEYVQYPNEFLSSGFSPYKNEGLVPNFTQLITSAETSVKQIPAIFKKFGGQLGPKNIDIGGGKYDLGTQFLQRKFGIKSRVYDPFNRSKEFNDETLNQLFGSADTATIANVLNVIKEPSARRDLLAFIKDSIKKKGKAYFSIYQGNRSGIGEVTSKGFQNNLIASKYEDEISDSFSNIQRHGNYIIGSNVFSGFNPYKSEGHIPNFANFQSGQSKDGLRKKGKSEGLVPNFANLGQDFIGAIENGSTTLKKTKNSLSDAHINYGLAGAWSKFRFSSRGGEFAGGKRFGKGSLIWTLEPSREEAFAAEDKIAKMGQNVTGHYDLHTGKYFTPKDNLANKGLIPSFARGERYLSSSQVPINPSSILGLMSKDERRVLVKLGEGASLAEISSEMRLPPNAISTLIENAKKSFTTKYGLAKQGRLSFTEGLVPNFGMPYQDILKFLHQARSTNQFFSLKFKKADGTIRDTPRAGFFGGNAEFERVRGAKGEFFGKDVPYDEKTLPFIDMDLYDQARKIGKSAEEAKKMAYRKATFSRILQINGEDITRSKGLVPNFANLVIPSQQEYLHRTYPEFYKDILKNGFNLKNFGATGKRFNVPRDSSLIKYDPAGIFAQDLPANSNLSSTEYAKFLVFKNAGRNNMFRIKNHDPNYTVKGQISKTFGGKTGFDLRKALLEEGFDSVDAMGEKIFLQPENLRILRTLSSGGVPNFNRLLLPLFSPKTMQETISSLGGAEGVKGIASRNKLQILTAMSMGQKFGMPAEDLLMDSYFRKTFRGVVPLSAAGGKIPNFNLGLIKQLQSNLVGTKGLPQGVIEGASLLGQRGIHPAFINNSPINSFQIGTKIIPKQGRGVYLPYDNQNLIGIRKFTGKNANQDYKNTFLHEYGHHVDFNYIKRNSKAGDIIDSSFLRSNYGDRNEYFADLFRAFVKNPQLKLREPTRQVLESILLPSLSSNKGLIPNFNLNLGQQRFDFLSQYLMGKVRKPIPTLSKNDYQDALGYLGYRTTDQLNKDITQGGFAGAFPFGRKQTGGIAGLLKKGGFKFNFSGGAIPNYNALSSAISRETTGTGIQPSQVRIGSSSLIKSAQNPLGLGVYNTRDEPGGLMQGINRVAAMGFDPKKAGIPNYAPTLISEAGSKLAPVYEQQAQSQFEKLQNSLRTQEKTFNQVTKEASDMAKRLQLTDQSLASMNKSFTGLAQKFSLSGRENLFKNVNQALVGPIPRQGIGNVGLNLLPSSGKVFNLPEKLPQGVTKEQFFKNLSQSFSSIETRGTSITDEPEKFKKSLQTVFPEARQELIRRKIAEETALQDVAKFRVGTATGERRALLLRQELDTLTAQEKEVGGGGRSLTSASEKDIYTEGVIRREKLLTPVGAGRMIGINDSERKAATRLSISERLQKERAVQFLHGDISRLISPRTLETETRSEIAKRAVDARKQALGIADPKERLEAQRQVRLATKEANDASRIRVKQEATTKQSFADQAKLQRGFGLSSILNTQTTRDIGKRNPELLREIRNQAQTKLLLGSSLLPLAGGILGEGILQVTGGQSRGSRGAAQAASGLGNVASFAAVGSILGPWGIAGGAALGAFSEVPKVFKAFTDVIPDLQNNLEKITERVQRTSTSLSGFTQVVSKLQQVNEQGGVTVGQRQTLLRERSRFLANAPASSRARLLAAEEKGDIAGIADIANIFSTIQEQQKNSVENSIRLLERIRKENPNKFLNRITTGARTDFERFGGKSGEGFTPDNIQAGSLAALSTVFGGGLLRFGTGLGKFDKTFSSDLGSQQRKFETSIINETLRPQLTDLFSLVNEKGFDLVSLLGADDLNKLQSATNPTEQLSTIKQVALSKGFNEEDINSIFDSLEKAVKDFPGAFNAIRKVFDKKFIDDLRNSQKILEGTLNGYNVAFSRFNTNLVQINQQLSQSLEKLNISLSKDLINAIGQIDIGQINLRGQNRLTSLRAGGGEFLEALLSRREAVSGIGAEKRSGALALETDFRKNIASTITGEFEKAFEGVGRLTESSVGVLKNSEAFNLRLKEMVDVFNNDAKGLIKFTQTPVDPEGRKGFNVSAQIDEERFKTLTVPEIRTIMDSLSTTVSESESSRQMSSSIIPEMVNLLKREGKDGETFQDLQKRISQRTSGGGPNDLSILKWLQLPPQSQQTFSKETEEEFNKTTDDLLKAIDKLSPELQKILLESNQEQLQSRFASDKIEGARGAAAIETLKKMEEIVRGYNEAAANIDTQSAVNVEKALAEYFNTLNFLGEKAAEDLKRLQIRNLEVLGSQQQLFDLEFQRDVSSPRDRLRLDRDINRTGQISKLIEDRDPVLTNFSAAELSPGKIEKTRKKIEEEIEGLNKSLTPSIVNKFGLSTANEFGPLSSMPPGVLSTMREESLAIAQSQLKQIITLTENQETAIQSVNQQYENQLKILNRSLRFAESRSEYTRTLNESRAFEGESGSFKAIEKDLGRTFLTELDFGQEDFWKTLAQSTQQFGSDFKDAFKSGFRDAITGAKDFGEAMRSIGLNIATSALTKTSDLAIDSLLGMASSSLGGGQSANFLTSIIKGRKNGGIIPKYYSRGGFVNMGSGAKDDVPALLSGGEFVVRKSAVDAVGRQNLEKINNKSPLPKQTDQILIGDNSFSALLANEYTGIGGTRQRPKKGELNVSPLLSTFALTDENNPQNALRFSREKYFIDLKEYRKEQQKALDDFEKKQRTSLITSWVMAGVNFGISNLNNPKPPSYTTSASDANLPYQKLLGYSSSRPAPAGTSYDPFRNVSIGPRGYNANGGLIKKYGFGGKVFGGDMYSDKIPAMLMGGEFVVQKPVVDKLGTDFFNQLNSSGARGYAYGGVVGNTYSPDRGVSLGRRDGEDMGDYFNRLIEVSQEIRNSLTNNKNTPSTTTGNNESSATNNINVSINITMSEGKVSQESQVSAGGGQNDNQRKNSRDGIDRETASQLSLLVKNQVVEVLAKESRPGGMLNQRFQTR